MPSYRVLAIGSAAIACCLALVAQSPPYKTIKYTSGQFDSTMRGSACSAPLAPGGSIDFSKLFDKDVETAGASFSAAGKCSMRFAVTEVNGPGTYGKDKILNLSMSWGGKVWNFNRRQDDCRFTFTRLDASAMEGTVRCSTSTPVDDVKFAAAP